MSVPAVVALAILSTIATWCILIAIAPSPGLFDDRMNDRQGAAIFAALAVGAIVALLAA